MDQVDLMNKIKFNVNDDLGVIGQYPKLTPGTYHTYASRTSFTVTRGTMGGFFTYRKLTQNRQSMLPTPTFTLQVSVI